MKAPTYAWALILATAAASFSYARSESSEPEPGSGKNAICLWTFNEKSETFVLEEIGRKKDSLHGNYEYVPGVYGNAIKLDGFRTYISRDSRNSTRPAGAFTVECWVALASYPWSWAPVADCSYERIKGFFSASTRRGV